MPDTKNQAAEEVAKRPAKKYAKRVLTDTNPPLHELNAEAQRTAAIHRKRAARLEVAGQKAREREQAKIDAEEKKEADKVSK